jgi:Domain of unknown function (DUF4304)
MSKRVVIARLDSLLKPLGFGRQKMTWNRRIDSVVDVVDVQVSKAGDAITVNVGVLDTEAHSTLWGSEPPAFVQQPVCTVCARIGKLIDDKDKWWQLSDSAIGDDMAEKIEVYVSPFLEQMHTREAMEQWLMDAQVVKKTYPPPIINLAILKSFLGKVAQGCALLAELQKKPIGDWGARVTEVAGRLRCALA